MHAIADDLFAGAGGWDLAAEAVGIYARGVENDPAARATREAAGLSTIHDDVWTFQPDGLAQGLIASPPCQTFSKAGKGSGRKALVTVAQALATDAYADKDELRALARAVGDERTALVLLPMHYATQHGHYRWLAWEQVPSVLPVWEACAAILRELGWRVWTGQMHAEQHGVPQTRTRAVLLARQDGEALPPLPTHSRYYPRTPAKLDEGVARWVTMGEALRWGMTQRPYPTVAPGIGTGGPDPMALGGKGGRQIIYDARASGDWVEQQTPSPSGVCAECGNDDASYGYAFCTDCLEALSAEGAGGHHLQTPSMLRANDRSGQRTLALPAHTVAVGHDAGQLRWAPTFVSQSGTPVDEEWPDKRPSTTVAGRDLVQNPGATANRYNGVTKSRNDGVRLTVAEAGVLQGFPATYPWQGNRSQQFRQVGNAIPPPMAAAVLAQACPQAADHADADATTDEGAA